MTTIISIFIIVALFNVMVYGVIWHKDPHRYDKLMVGKTLSEKVIINVLVVAIGAIPPFSFIIFLSIVYKAIKERFAA